LKLDELLAAEKRKKRYDSGLAQYVDDGPASEQEEKHLP
jgi:hypothetical protein